MKILESGIYNIRCPYINKQGETEIYFIRAFYFDGTTSLEVKNDVYKRIAEEGGINPGEVSINEFKGEI